MSPIRSALSAPAAASALAALAALLFTGCTWTSGMGSGDKVDYKAAAAKTSPLEVPPDLTQLAREGRYQPQAGVVSASSVATGTTQPPRAAPGTPGAPSGTGAAAPASAGTVAPGRAGEARIERQGQQRWLVTAQTPEQLWPLLRSFWEKNGFTLALDNPQLGLMETNWNENRAKLPKDAVRSFLTNIGINAYDSGERDLFRTRVERTETGTEVYISHRGLQEVFVSDLRREVTTWRARPSDPELEAEFLGRLMLALGGVEDTTRATAPAAGAAPGAAAARPGAAVAAPAAAASAVAAPPEAPARARLLAETSGAALEVDEPFDRAWRRVGLALDRGGFTVEDRDRAQGLYYVRYVDPASAGQEEPNFFARLFSSTPTSATPVRYRVVLKGQGNKTVVSVLTSAGATDSGENGKRIAERLVRELK